MVIYIMCGHAFITMGVVTRNVHMPEKCPDCCGRESWHPVDIAARKQDDWLRRASTRERFLPCGNVEQNRVDVMA